MQHGVNEIWPDHRWLPSAQGDETRASRMHADKSVKHLIYDLVVPTQNP
jgi:hypothetical protein